ncbi:hypothetical protein J4208_02370 [Candidatus Woesearchaeota archaeon]|nr:hypothetical protein [Candidatus Woesearchaeota archaeon]
MTIDDTCEDCPNTEQDERILLKGDLGRDARILSSAHQQEIALKERILAGYKGKSTLRREDHAEVAAMTGELALGGELLGFHFLNEDGKEMKGRDNYGSNKPIYV